MARNGETSGTAESTSARTGVTAASVSPSVAAARPSSRAAKSASVTVAWANARLRTSSPVSSPTRARYASTGGATTSTMPASSGSIPSSSPARWMPPAALTREISPVSRSAPSSSDAERGALLDGARDRLDGEEGAEQLDERHHAPRRAADHRPRGAQIETERAGEVGERPDQRDRPDRHGGGDELGQPAAAGHDRRGDRRDRRVQVELGDQLRHTHGELQRAEQRADVGEPGDDAVEPARDRRQRLRDPAGADAADVERDGHVDVETGELDVREQCAEPGDRRAEVETSGGEARFEARGQRHRAFLSPPPRARCAGSHRGGAGAPRRTRPTSSSTPVRPDRRG